MKAKLIVLKLFLFTIVNVWLLYLIGSKIELDKLCITCAWLDYLINLTNSNLRLELNPTIEVKLFMLLCVFFLFGLIFLIIIAKVRPGSLIGVSILMIFMSKILYKVQNNFLTLGQDINILGLTMEHVMSVKEKLTLLKDYIKNNNIIIDNQDFIVIWDAIKPLKKLGEVKETVELLVQELKQKELSNLEYMYSLLTVPNVMMTLTGLTVVGGLIYIGYWGYNKLNDKIESINNENTEDVKDAVLKEDLDRIKEENKNFMQERIDSVYDNFKEELNKMKEENKNIIEEGVKNLKNESMSRLDAIDNKFKIVKDLNNNLIILINNNQKSSREALMSIKRSVIKNKEELSKRMNALDDKLEECVNGNSSPLEYIESLI